VNNFGNDPSGETPDFDPLEPINFADLALQSPERGPVVIDGVLREGAVGTVVSGTKGRKSWAMGALIAAALTGGNWFGHAVTRGRVALIDGELTRATIFWRLGKIFEVLRVPPTAFDGLDVWDMRGRTKDVDRAVAAVRAKGAGYYKIVVVDPLYCFYPDTPGFSENDNAAMRRVYDELIGFAGDTRAATMVVHHASKGNQSDKGLTDLGSGAGAISRAGDAHIAFRPHAEKGAVVFEGVPRDFPDIIPSCWRWGFPLFQEAPDLDPTKLAGKRPQKNATQDFLDGGKATPPAWTPESYAANFITGEGKTLPRLQGEAAKEGIAERRAKALTEQAVEMGYAHEWPGRNGPGGCRKRYANIPCPITETDGPKERENAHARPPTPPAVRKRTRGGGDARKQSKAGGGGK